MRLLYYTTSYYAKHGGSIQSIELYKNLRQFDELEAVDIFPENNEKTKVSGRKTGFKEKLKKNRFFQILFFYRRNQFYLKSLSKKIESFKPDVILIQIDSNFLQINYLRKKYPDLVICTQINGSPFDEPFKNIGLRRYFLNLQRKSYKKSNLNIFISEYSRKWILGEKIDQKRNIIVYNGTDVNKFFPFRKEKERIRGDLEYPNKSFIFGYIGTLDHHKKMEILINAFYKLNASYKNLYLVIIGDGPAFNKIKESIAKLRLLDKVKLEGWIPHDEINTYLNSFDVAIHHYANPYMNPLKIFEYLSAGLPVIAPGIPSIKSSFRDKEDLLITGQGEEELRNKMELVINDVDLRSRLSNNQDLIKRLKNNYTWKKYAEKIVTNILRVTK